MKTFDIIPITEDSMFGARVVMSDYNSDVPLMITINARRDDGARSSQTIVYPEPNIEYAGYVKAFFFNMTKNNFAQITSVWINGNEVMNYFTELADLDIQARYDDSITTLQEVVNLNKIHLDFQVMDTGDPYILSVVDTSDWGMLQIRKSIIEITLPGFKDPIVHFYAKNQINNFTSLTLDLNCNLKSKCDYDLLPDGIYDIIIKGSPSSYNFNRKYLRTNRTQLALDELYVRASLCEHRDVDLWNKIKEAKALMDAAESNVRLGNFNTAHKLLDKVNEIIKQSNNCVNC